QRRHGDRHVYTPVSRFLPAPILPRFERVSVGRGVAALEQAESSGERTSVRVDVAAKLRDMW
ncbi:MAG: hypothetical protein AAGC55_28650, partial [Myxococcota bacterium]